MTVPRLTPEEKRRALQKAQKMRSERAKVRSRLKSGDLTLRDVLESSEDQVVGGMRVKYLLESLPRVGKVTSRKLMEEIGISESRRIQGLGKRQQNELLARLG